MLGNVNTQNGDIYRHIHDSMLTAEQIEQKRRSQIRDNEKIYGYAMNEKYAERAGEVLESQAGKKGNIESAKEIATKYIKDEYIDKFSKKYQNVVIIPVVGEDTTTTNILPQYIAKYLAEVTGNGYYSDIYKTSRNNFREKSAKERMFSEIEFDLKKGTNKDLNNKRFVIFDDCISTGTTVSALRDYIEANGGVVVGFASIGKGRDNTDNIAITSKQFEMLKKLVGKEYSYELSRLTARRQKRLLKTKKSGTEYITEKEYQELMETQARVEKAFEEEGRALAQKRREELQKKGIL